MIRSSRLGAVAVLAALGTTAVIVMLPDGSEPAPTSSSSTTSSPPSTVAAPLPVATTGPTTSTPVAATDPVKVVAGGLEAWGRFAVTGDLGLLDRWFDPAGPQFRQFQEESGALAADPPGEPAYEVTMDETAVGGSGDEVTVEGRVVFIRTGEPSQSFDWLFVLRPVGHGWRIWTVEDRR